MARLELRLGEELFELDLLSDPANLEDMEFMDEFLIDCRDQLARLSDSARRERVGYKQTIMREEFLLQEHKKKYTV
jgi:hypothetical protein